MLHKKDLIPMHNLKEIFRDIRDYFAGNVTGITRDETIARNIMRLLFCKIFDEREKSGDRPVEFTRRPDEGAPELAARMQSLFERVKKQHPDIFETNEKIEVSPADLSFIVSKLEPRSILDAERDIIADAFEELIGTSFRGGEGQFFTPRNIVRMMIEVLEPDPGEMVIDPACGSGGFLAHIVRHYQQKGNGRHRIYGLDKDLFLSRLAKIYLTLLGEGEYHVFCENSLEDPRAWSPEARGEVDLESFDMVMTNPPFGAKIPVVGGLLEQYELGRHWKRRDGAWVMTDNMLDKQPPQILFIERVIQLLKQGGRAGIVLPEGIFGNPSDRYIWEYVKKHASIIGVVGLSHEAFQPSTHTKTSVLFIEKKKRSRKRIFMAIADAVGHNKNGKEIYRMNADGTFVLDDHGERIIDDDTPAITEKFSDFLHDRRISEDHLGFLMDTADINDNIYIPESYSPEIKQELSALAGTGRYAMISIGDLVRDGVIGIARGNEIGSRYYGTGPVPFVRTTDIVNWEIKIDPVKCVSEEVYLKYRDAQDVRAGDILFVNDGTFLIGRCALVTDLDEKCVIQSHLRKIRVLESARLNAYYLLYLLNRPIVQKQIGVKTFIQATLSTLGNRLLEVVLPVHLDGAEVRRITAEVEDIMQNKKSIRTRISRLIVP
ncbi:MAG: N-6 DNA methylase [Spirochaetes bacterium]|nr:N-6 DNA methylase [Spirochaetota bacterium]